MLNNIKVSAKIFAGFGVVLALLLAIAGVGYFSLDGANTNFGDYRSLARETNAVGRVQANMLMTRLFVKNFVISASDENIAGVKERAEKTLSLIEGAKELATDEANIAKNDTQLASLHEYIAAFDQVTAKQAERNVLVNETLNVIGPQMERDLTAIMESAFKDGDAEAAFDGGMVLRNLLLARLYSGRYLIQNDQASYERVQKEFKEMKTRQAELLSKLENPVRRELATKVGDNLALYRKAFENVYQVIGSRNNLIKNELDRIGPEVATSVEDMKLHIKTQQDELGPRAEAEIARAELLTLSVSAIGAFLGMLAAWFIGTGISKPVVSMTTAMRKLADGNLEADVPAQGRGDEIGQMAGAVQVFKENAIRVKEMEAEQVEAEKRAEAEKKAAMNKLADDFEAAVGGVVNQVSSASTEMQASSEAMAATAEETSTQSATVAAASEQASANVQTVASAAEELSSSISEISRQVGQSSEIASNAVRQAEQTNEKVQGLAEAANKIGEVVALITDIADQTNLLALNATIEAARAGDAGKGFAVVASEVKNLANQTAKATDEIGTQISGIQTSTQEAVTAIEEIGKTISEVDEIATTIASAVEEQGAATQEIARNVEQAASGTQEVSSNIGGVNQAASDTGAAATQIQSAAGELSQQSELLRSEVDKFLGNVRAA